MRVLVADGCAGCSHPLCVRVQIAAAAAAAAHTEACEAGTDKASEQQHSVWRTEQPKEPFLIFSFVCLSKRINDGLSLIEHTTFVCQDRLGTEHSRNNRSNLISGLTWIFVCAFVMQERDAPASGDTEPDAAGGSALHDDGALAVAKAQEALSLLPKLQDDAQDGGVEAAAVRCPFCCRASRADLSGHGTS